MKNFKEILKKLKVGGFMSLSLKERKAVVREEAKIYQTRLYHFKNMKVTINQYFKVI